MNKLALALLLVASIASTARADAPADAMALFDQGLKDLNAGNTDVACKELAASLQKYSDSGTKGALATCYTKLGKVASAWKLWRDLADTAPNDAMKKDAGGNASQLEARLPHFVIHLQVAAVPGLKIVAGGDEVSDPTLAVPLPIDPGPFVVTASAPDHADWTMSFTAAEGKTTTIDVPALVATSKSAPPGPLATPGVQTVVIRQDLASARHGRHVMAITIGAIGAGAVVVGSIFGGVASSQWNTAQHDCGGNVATCPTAVGPKAEQEVQSAKTSALVSTIAVSAGAVGLVAGAILYLSAPSIAEHPTTAWRVAPAASPASVGFTLSRGW
jgi:hypothetical protein